jgi:1,2-diacylglycerol-3-alpha-glucose alpha-1,2-galactosyltransferase
MAYICHNMGMRHRLRINIVSETVYTAKAHGVHTAFLQMVRALKQRDDVELTINGWKGAEVVHVHTIGPYSLLRLLLHRGKAVVSAHVTPDSFVGSLVGARAWYPLAKAYLRWYYNRANLVLAVSNEVLGELKAMGVKRPIELMPNTIDTSQFASSAKLKAAARQQLGIASDAFVVIGVGQVQPRKGIDSFIRGAEAHPDMRFIWVGGVPFKQLAADYHHMEDLMKHPPSNLSYTGNLDQEAVVAYYRAADVFWLPSHQETFGIVIVEAAAAGLPVLLRDTDQYRDTFTKGYIASSEERFNDELAKLRSDASYRQKWSKEAAAIAQRYDSKAGTERLVQLYHQLLDNRL